MSSISYSDLLIDIRRIAALVPPLDRRSVVLNPADASALEHLGVNRERFCSGDAEAPMAVLGFPVVVSSAIPVGEIVFAKLTPEPFRFRPILVDDVARIFRVPRRLLRRRSRRLEVKRWIRDEINARRLARRIGT